ncbi:MAG: manganese efflux pump [Planctomycetes bacterium]|nr:manganese efflux pump [Planctomycetota bacterium]
MSVYAIILLACALAMDACAVAMIQGGAHPRFRAREAATMAVTFGVFQGVMPMLGWCAGSLFKQPLAAYGDWIGFALLSVIGLKMVWEGVFHREPGADGDRGNPFAGRMLLVLAFATSVDAFAVGIGLPLLDVALVAAVTLIATITMVLVLFSLYAGRRFGAFASDHMDIIGGLVLISMGVHLVSGHIF